MLLVLQDRHVHDSCDMYPYVSGDFKPVEIYSNASSFGKSGIDEAGMGQKNNA